MALYEKQSDGTYKKISQIYAGKSAYDLAVENGFKGSEVEWLTSLKTATVYLVDVPTVGWSGNPYMLTISTPGINPTDELFWDIELDASESASDVSDKLLSYNQIDKIKANKDFITLYSWNNTPVVAFSIKVVAIHATET